MAPLAERPMLRGRFAEPLDALALRFNASVDVDERLVPYDILGSLAHCLMLERCGLLAAADAQSIRAGLRELWLDAQAGRFVLRLEREDVHMNVEATLAERLGPTAGRLHTARSRNDQVALDVRLYLREAVAELLDAIQALCRVLLRLARRHAALVFPGYTHLQRAQPVTFGHHLTAYVQMLLRDHARFEDAYARFDELPLGSGALAATPLPIDREFVAKLLGFPRITANSQDGVAARDHELEVLAAAAITMTHLSRLCEELVLWASQEFGFVRLPDAFCTGSSIMPQKRNPDIAELVRGKSGRVVGALTALLVTLKGLPLAYNKDLQEDRQALFTGIDTLGDSLRVLAALLDGVVPEPRRMRQALDEGYLTATDLADALVERGVPFRRAHETVARLVAACAAAGATLTPERAAEALRNEGLPTVADLAAVLDPERSVARRDVPGGPAPRRVRAAIEAAQGTLRQQRRRQERRLGTIRAARQLLEADPA